MGKVLQLEIGPIPTSRSKRKQFPKPSLRWNRYSSVRRARFSCRIHARMYDEQFTTWIPCAWNSFSKRIPSMSTMLTSSRSSFVGNPNLSISVCRSTRCTHRSAPDKKIRVPCFSQIRLIFNVIVGTQTHLCKMQREDHSQCTQHEGVSAG